MEKESKNRAFICLGMIACLLFTGLLVFPAVSADDQTKVVGMVMKENYMPIEASITLTNIHTGDVKTTETTNGAYFFNVEPGFYTVKADAQYYLDTGKGHSDVIMVKKGETKRVTDLILKPVDHSIKVTGFVKSMFGEAIANATVTAVAQDAAYEGYFLTTTTDYKVNHTGEYTLNLYNFGNFNLYVTAPGYNITVLPLYVNGTMSNVNVTIYMAGETDYLIYGYARDKATLDYLSGVKAYAYDLNEGRYIEAAISGGSYFQIQAYEGVFELIVDVPGYRSYYNDSIELNASAGKAFAFVSAEMDADIAEDINTTITFSGDFTTMTLESKWVITSESQLFGLGSAQMGTPRMQIDTALGDGNKDVSSAEALAFKNWLVSAGPYYLYTNEFLSVNGSGYEPSFTGGVLDYTVEEMSGVEDDVMSPNQMSVSTKMVYVATEDMSDEFENSSAFAVSVKKIRDNEKITLVAPTDFEVLGTDNADYWKAFVTEAKDFNIRQGVAPVAKIQVINEGSLYKNSSKVYIIDAGVNITLKSTSTDAVGEIVNTTWELGEAGKVKYTNEITFMYNISGLHTLKLKVLDSSNLASEANLTFYVDVEAPTLEVQVLNATLVDITNACEEGTAKEAEDTKITLKANGTMDNIIDEANLTFTWKFTDNTAPIIGKVTTHTFSVPGTYNITLEVTDIIGHSKNMTYHGFVVLDKTAPFPVISSENTVDMGKALKFNASQSYDPDYADSLKYTQVSSFEWDFDYDGKAFVKDADGKEVNWTFTKAGEHKVMLKVSDHDGNVANTTKTITVHGPDFGITMAPKVKPSKDLEEGDDITFTVNVSNVGQIDWKNVTVSGYYEIDGKEKRFATETIPSLKAGEKTNITMKWKNIEPGKKVKISFRVDPEDAVGEINEKNNVWNLTLKVDKSWTTIIVLSVVGGIIVLLIVAYFVYRKFFAEGGDEDRKSKRQKAGKKKDEEEEEEEEEEDEKEDEKEDDEKE